jgi:hypothetical protein
MLSFRRAYGKPNQIASERYQQDAENDDNAKLEKRFALQLLQVSSHDH